MSKCHDARLEVDPKAGGREDRQRWVDLEHRNVSSRRDRSIIPHGDAVSKKLRCHISGNYAENSMVGIFHGPRILGDERTVRIPVSRTL